MKKRRFQLWMPLFLWAMWLLLNDSLSAGNIVLGLVIALVLTWAATPLRPLRAFPRHPWTACRLIAHVAIDVVASNFAVARLILSGRSKVPRRSFVRIPLDLRDPHGLAALACIVTYTPGTAWAGFSEHDRILTLHVLDLHDENHWIQVIKQRYEQPLKEIFE